MATIAEEALELEAMRKEDRSWHPCCVSLRSRTPTAFSIVVESANFAEEDITSNKEEALTRLRYRSISMQDGECSSIEEGEHVLAMNKDHSKSLFFDAVVDKAWRLKHSKRVHCRCKFEVKWLHSKWNWNAQTISSSSIMKLSRKSISSHPVIAEFLHSLNPNSHFDVPSYLSFPEEIKGEVDIQGLLEKQVEEISRLANASFCSNKEVMPTCSKVDLAGHTQRKTIVAEFSLLHSPNNVIMFTKDENKLQIQTKAKGNLENKEFLNPLAARAALASLVHELPQEPEFSVCEVEKEDYTKSPLYDAGKHIDVPLMCTSPLFRESNMLVFEDVSVVSELSEPNQETNKASVWETKQECETPLIKQRCPMKRSQVKKVVNDQKQTDMPKEPDGRKLDRPKIMKISRHSVMKGDSIGSTNMVRLTRSMVHRGNQELADELERSPSNEDKPINEKQLKCLGKKKGDGCPILETGQEPEKISFTQETRMEDYGQGPVTSKCIKNKTKLVTSPIDSETISQAEGKKRTRLSSATVNDKEDQGDISAGRSIPKRKKAISPKPEVRFSQRLKFLPRTRSQNKR